MYMYISLYLYRKCRRNRRIRRNKRIQRQDMKIFLSLGGRVLSSQKRIVAPNFVVNFVSEPRFSRAKCRVYVLARVPIHIEQQIKMRVVINRKVDF